MHRTPPLPTAAAACAVRAVQIVKALLEAGADPDLAYNRSGFTALHVCAGLSLTARRAKEDASAAADSPQADERRDSRDADQQRSGEGSEGEDAQAEVVEREELATSEGESEGSEAGDGGLSGLELLIKAGGRHHCPVVRIVQLLVKHKANVRAESRCSMDPPEKERRMTPYQLR